MKTLKKVVFSLVFIYSFFIYSYSSFAVTITSSYWNCTTYDGSNQQWTNSSEYQISAVNKAFEACKKESKIPKTCKTSKQDCEMVVNGVVSRPMWRCMALDEAGIPWFSNIYTHADDAISAAKTFCQANSALPETCYLYPFTCRNLNTREF